MNNYGVYDSIFSEFIESFPTLADAENYVENQIKKGEKDFKIVRFINNYNNDYEVLKRY